jgi:hypothetical protein
MDGPSIIAASMSVAQPRGPKPKKGQADARRRWQYHSRSDLHSKVGCWAVLFDLLEQSALMKKHATQGKIVFGVNHKLTDWHTNKEKDLDLVIARPDGNPTAHTLIDLAAKYHVVLDHAQQQKLAGMPAIYRAPVGGVLVALEAKAAMTEHVKALPRFYDELNSSHQIVHGASNQALAVGLAMVNASATFISPDRNKTPGAAPVVTAHKQPHAATAAVNMVRNKLPRRSSGSGVGYDGLAILVVSAANDGTPIKVVTTPPAPPHGDVFHYDNMITRVANEYDTTFSSI